MRIRIGYPDREAEREILRNTNGVHPEAVRPVLSAEELLHLQEQVSRVSVDDTLVDYMLQKTTHVLDTMFVYPERMETNLESTGGLVFSGQLLLDLVEHGVSREEAYRTVQSHAMRAWKEGRNFLELVLKDKSITSRVPRQQIERAFDLKRQLRNIDKIFARVFGGAQAKAARQISRKRRKPPRSR